MNIADLHITGHAHRVIQERQIPMSYIEKVLHNPQLTHPDTEDEELVHYLAAIKEAEGRVLRVIINRHAVPNRLITVYYDRDMRGKI